MTAEKYMEKLYKKKLEFSKAHVLYANFLVTLVYAGSFLLAWFEKPGVEVMQIALAIIAAYGAFATGGYFTQNIMRAKSLNELKGKHVEHRVNKEEAHYD